MGPAPAPPTLAVNLAPAAPSPETYTPNAAQEQQAVSLMSRGLQAAMSQQGGALTLRLNPPTLGSLRIEVRVEQGVVSASIEASTQAGRDILARNLDALRSALESRGLEPHRLEARLAPAPVQGQPASNHAGSDADRSTQRDQHDDSQPEDGARDERSSDDSQRRSGRDEQEGVGQNPDSDALFERGYLSTRFGDHLRMTLSAVA